MLLPVLQIKNLSILFGTDGKPATALSGIDLTINRGEVVAIVGESGSGKTITSLALLQLLPEAAIVATGEILFYKNGSNDKPIDLLKENEGSIRKIRGNSISMIFQEPMTSLNPLKKCGEQVAESLRIHKNISVKEALKQTAELFDLVQLPDPEGMLYRYPHEISGGQKQRVMIAMAMSCNPDILIADEPTTALDVTVQKTILQLLKNLQAKNNMSIIYITHDLGLVADIADRVVVMYRGQIIEQGNVTQIFTNPQKPYTRALLSCRPTPASKGKRLPVINDFLNAQGFSNAEIVNEQLQTNYDAATLNANKHAVLGLSEKEIPILQVENLKVYFPVERSFLGKVTKYFKAVDDVSFEIGNGETLGLVGESGCGKTTLGRTLIRLIDPYAGRILFAGKNIAEIDKESLRRKRKNIQIIFQDPYGSLNPRMTIGDALNEPMKAHHILPNDKSRKEKIIHLLEKVQLKPDHFNRYPHEFSGGQRQRICIARALGLSPEFIICDESVSALDVSVQAQVLNLLNDLKSELGFTCIFISHDLSVVHYISDRIMVMNKGKIVETGTADEIYFNPQEKYTQGLIASIPKVHF
ncbi:MAG: ABC transporter ATP-binding protein [Bacteroidetes bacterium]|nr:ABC transporter ATP-binding protein [Bacteroidota bacterium]